LAVIFRCVQCGRSLGWREATPVASCKAHGSAPELSIERLDRASERVVKMVTDYFGHSDQILWGSRYEVADHPCVVASEGGYPVGFTSYAPEGDTLTIVAVAVDPQYQGSGAGGKMYRELDAIAAETGAKTIRTTTTNDNVLSIYFHQRQGFVLDSLVAIPVGDLEVIGAEGMGGIPLRQEVRLVKNLTK
jgi:ribosomal protein S18 acetylase RimI-like enzyme